MAAILTAGLSSVVNYGITQAIYSLHERQKKQLQQKYLDAITSLAEEWMGLHGKGTNFWILPPPNPKDTFPGPLLKEICTCECQGKVDGCDQKKTAIRECHMTCLTEKKDLHDAFKKNEGVLPINDSRCLCSLVSFVDASFHSKSSFHSRWICRSQPASFFFCRTLSNSHKQITSSLTS